MAETIYDKTTRETVHEALRRVRTWQDGPEPKRGGICLLLGDALIGDANSRHDGEQALLRELFKQWPDYSGDINYPVPAPLGWGTPEQAYFGDDPHGRNAKRKGLQPNHQWAKGTAYGDARRALLAYLIERTAKAPE